MINVDAQGNKFIRAVDGSVIPLEPVAVNIRVETALNGQILSITDALAVERALAYHWFARYQEAQTTIADLRAQLANGS